MERSMSSYTEYTDYTESSTHTQYPTTDQPYPTSGSSQPFTPTEPHVDVNGELVSFAELDLAGMGGAELQGMGFDPQWNAGAPQGDYQDYVYPQLPAQLASASSADTSYNDSFDSSFPLQAFPLQPQLPLTDSWIPTAPEHSPPADFQPNFGYTAPPMDYSYAHPNVLDEGSNSLPGTGLISPQASFPPAFVNPQEYQPPHHYPNQLYYTSPHFPHGTLQYQHTHLVPNTITGLMPGYTSGHLPNSVPLSRGNSMSSTDKVRLKTCLTKEDRLAIYEMSKLPNVRQQDVAEKYKIDRSTVSKIVTEFKKLAERLQSGEEEVPVPKQSKSGVARYPEVDTAVGLHVDARAAQGLTTSPEELHTLALKVAAESGHLDFKASVKWSDNFYKRRAAEGKADPVRVKKTTPNPQHSTPVPSPTIAAKPVNKAIPISKSFSTTSLSEMAGPSHARQRSQSSPQKAGVLPIHQQPLPISQSSLGPRPSLTRSNSMNVSSRAGRGHRSRASVDTSFARSAFQLDTPLAPVREDGPVTMPLRSRHTHSRSDALGLGSWASMPPAMMGHTPYHPMPAYAAYAPPHPPIYNDFQPAPGPSGSKRARR